MIRPVNVRARPGYSIWVEFSDGVAGEVDLSDLVGQGVFKAWNTPGCFEAVYLASDGAVAWGDDIDLCSESLYIDLTGKPVEEVMTGALFKLQNT